MAPTRSGQRFRSDDVRLGTVMTPFGLRGEFRVFLYNPESELLNGPTDVVLVGEDGSRQALQLTLSPGTGRRIIGSSPGLRHVDQAAVLHGMEIVLPQDRLPPPAPGEYYHSDLIGLPVFTRSGQDLGHLAEIYSQSEVDTWVVRGPDGEHYVAALREVVLEVRPGDRIIVDDDAGHLL